MEAACWSPDNCQVVPSFDNQTSVPFDMDSMNQEVDYHMQQHQQQYCQDFDNFNINFDDLLFCGLIEKPKEDSTLINQVQTNLNCTPVDRPVTVKTENVEMYNVPCNMPMNQVSSPSNMYINQVPNPCNVPMSQVPSPCNTMNQVPSPCGMSMNQVPSRPQSLNTETTSNCDFNSPPPSMFGRSTTEDGIELYHDLIMRHLVQDIQSTCDRLNIPSDPRCWSTQHTQSWLMDMAHQLDMAHHLNNMPLEQLIMPGSQLCSLGLDALKQAYQTGGELVHAQLNLWTTASDYSMRHQNIQQSAHLPLKMNPEDGTFASAWSPTAYTASAVQSHVYPPLMRYPAKIESKASPKRRIVMPVSSPQGFGTFLPSPSSDSGISTDMDEYTDCDSLSPLNSPHHHAPSTSNNIHLWQFLRELLDNQEKYSHCVRWIDRTQGIFKIEDSHKLAKLWGQRKNRPAMNYDKLSRSLRQYYRKGILKKTPRSQRLVYQFLPPYHIC